MVDALVVGMEISSVGDMILGSLVNLEVKTSVKCAPSTVHCAGAESCRSD